MVVIINMLPGEGAKAFRLNCAETVVRVLGGDETLVQEIRVYREAQAHLPAAHPASMFGEAVAAAGAGSAGQLVMNQTNSKSSNRCALHAEPACLVQAQRGLQRPSVCWRSAARWLP